MRKAGSFFKNAEVSDHRFEELRKEFPEIVGHPLSNGKIKVAAGWLVEQCGWKGYREADVGVYPHQALVLVNYGNAKGEEIYRLSEKILQAVQSRFHITLEREVNIF